MSGKQTVVRNGSFRRTSDSKQIQRFRCLICQKSFSRATHHPFFGQKKRHKNHKILLLLAAAVSQREIARVEGVNRKTVARKLRALGPLARDNFLLENAFEEKCVEIQFDEMETFEHTKFKPLSIPLAVQTGSRRILSFQVAQMPAKGLLAKRAVKKFGYRKDERRLGRNRLFEELKSLVVPNAVIRSDSNPHYPEDVKRYFPLALHETVLGKRGAITGQGELKKIDYDPLFSLNHTCAMFRAHTASLIRKTWNTTKSRERLFDLLSIYAFVHNRRLRKQPVSLRLQ